MKRHVLRMLMHHLFYTFTLLGNAVCDHTFLEAAVPSATQKTRSGGCSLAKSGDKGCVDRSIRADANTVRPFC